jgi:effector-binding domain-containing protein
MESSNDLRMIEEPQIVQTAEQAVALIHLTVPRSQIASVMRPAFEELGTVLKAQNVVPAGAWLAHHLHRPTDVFDFELCSPVDQPVQPTGRVTNGKLRAAKVARTVYQGAYEGLPAAWGEFVAWINANGHHPATDLWEVYLVGPHDAPDPGSWRTEFNCPLTN